MKKKYYSASFALILISISIICFSCNDSSKSSNVANVSNETDAWYSNQNWLNGLKLTPNKSINQQEFSRQYHLNNKWWDEAFIFLKTHNLAELSPGKYVIDSGNVIATVWQGVPKSKDSVQWEAHRKFNDLQYVISGQVQMGITSIDNPDKNITYPYSSKEDIEHVTLTSGDKYFKADSSSFFIFSPEEIHRPAINVDGESTIKKIVIKVRVPG